MGLVRIQGYGCTNRGNHRSTNEDYFKINKHCFALADGMGGHNAGDIASKMTVDHLIESLDFINDEQYSIVADIKETQTIISNMINITNEIIYQQSQKHVEYAGMGTTIVLAVFQPPSTIHIANIGDSRAYLFRDNKLRQLTEDHSITATLLRDGTISEDEVQNHPYRHHLSQSLGTKETVNPYSLCFQIMPDDIILLCSDGLWNSINDDEIKDVLSRSLSSKELCNKLIATAIQQSKDNITCIVLKVTTE